MSIENERLKACKRYLDFKFEKDSNLRDIAMVASSIMAAPVSLITLIDKDIQWIITPHGIDIQQMPRQTSFCTHAIEQEDVMVVPDTVLDDRFKEAPLVKFNPNVRFYAGMPLKSDDGYNIGTLCVFDDKPREPDATQLSCLQALTRQVSNIMELNMSLEVIRDNHHEIETQYQNLRNIAYIQSHEVRAPLCNALGVMEMIRMDGYKSDSMHLNMMEKALNDLDGIIHKIVGITDTDGAA